MTPPKSLTFFNGTHFGIPSEDSNHELLTPLPLTTDCPKSTFQVDADKVSSSVSALQFALDNSGMAIPGVTSTTAAAILGLNPMHMRRLITKGCLYTYVSGSKTLIRLADLPDLARKLE